MDRGYVPGGTALNFQDRLLKHIKRWNELVGNIDHPNLFKETNMNYFIGWKIGIPVKVTAEYRGNQDAVRGEVRLIDENASTFIIVVQRGGAVVCNKNYYHYELIPYEGGGVKPRYPVIQNKFRQAYCNYGGDMETLTTVGLANMVRLPEEIATLIIDGKTIELSRETIDRLKKELGVG